jgi:hypothetical protein
MEDLHKHSDASEEARSAPVRKHVSEATPEQLESASAVRVHCVTIPEGIRELREANIGEVVVKDGGGGTPEVTLNGKPVQFMLTKRNRFQRRSEKRRVKAVRKAKQKRK